MSIAAAFLVVVFVLFSLLFAHANFSFPKCSHVLVCCPLLVVERAPTSLHRSRSPTNTIRKGCGKYFLSALPSSSSFFLQSSPRHLSLSAHSPFAKAQTKVTNIHKHISAEPTTLLRPLCSFFLYFCCSCWHTVKKRRVHSSLPS